MGRAKLLRTRVDRCYEAATFPVVSASVSCCRSSDGTPFAGLLYFRLHDAGYRSECESGSVPCAWRLPAIRHYLGTGRRGHPTKVGLCVGQSTQGSGRGGLESRLELIEGDGKSTVQSIFMACLKIFNPRHLDEGHLGLTAESSSIVYRGSDPPRACIAGLSSCQMAGSTIGPPLSDH